MLRILWATISIVVLTQTSEAASLKLRLINKSAAPINSFTATLKGAPVVSSPNRLTTPIAAGVTSQIQFDPGSTCIYDLVFASSADKITMQLDADLCQTDSIMIQ